MDYAVLERYGRPARIWLRPQVAREIQVTTLEQINLKASTPTPPPSHPLSCTTSSPPPLPPPLLPIRPDPDDLLPPTPTPT